MKIAIPASSTDINLPIDGRFGRARYFAIFDDQQNQWSFRHNEQNISLPQGAGIQSAKHIIESNAQVLLTCNVGPKAFDLLTRAGISIYLCDENLSISDAVKGFKNGSLNALQNPTNEGHW